MVRNIAGATLIETMVSLTIVGIAALAFAQLSSNFGSVRKFMQSSINYRDFASQLEETVSTADRCESALGGEIIDPLPGSPAVNVTLKMPRNSGNVGDTISYSTAGNVYYDNDPASGLRIAKVELLNASTARNSPTGSPIQDAKIMDGGATVDVVRYYMNLTVSVDRANSGDPTAAQLGGNFRPRVFGLNVMADPVTHKILRCNSDANLEQACIEANGRYLAGPPPRCDLTPAFGGCIFGGSYGLDDSRCEWGNPVCVSTDCPSATTRNGQTCGCPTGFTMNKIIDFDAGKSKARNIIELWNCYKCT